ncbi:MAG: ThuA domain-containing protein [Bryobacterales bacterium]|nr:ThuA domain-containing protein [Bryobacterales bacterium]
MFRRTLLAALFPPPKPKIVFVTGDDEYRSEYTMPALAALLEKHHNVATQVLYARPRPQVNNNIEGLEALKDADLAVFFLRWRELPEDQLQAILAYEKSGRPMAGFRTATHSLKYPKGSVHEVENDAFSLRAFGAKWTRHHGHLSTTRSERANDHEVLNGVNPNLTLPSWLYSVNPLHGPCIPLLTGHAINPQNGRDDGPQPLAWVKQEGKRRVFFTTAGHPEDFRNPDFRRLALNGILWALGRKIPAKGANADWPAPYQPPASGFIK